MKKNIIIVGSGVAGKLLMKDIRENHQYLNVIGYIDDHEEDLLEGYEYLGAIKDFPSVGRLFKIDEIIIAIPSASGEIIRQILLQNSDNRTPIKIVPRSQFVIANDRVLYGEVQDVDVEDLLGRSVKKMNVTKLVGFYDNKSVFITGGAGSIGSEIVRQLLHLGIKRVTIYDSSEYLVFMLDQQLQELGISKDRYKLVIGNVLNLQKLQDVLKECSPDIIFHAAAYKHVYLMQDNADEAVNNNVIGTKNVVDSAIECRVKYFTFISTDKVVNPTNIMGASKKLSEYYISEKKNTKTNFSIVRFGNVINSNGSVLPTFERQINEGRYITVTHKDISRFFMSIREASQLVIDSVTSEGSGEIYILDMGDLLNINEVGSCLIRSKNLIPEKDIEIRYIGLKKGEKMIEELFTEKERVNMLKTETDKIYRLKNHESCPKDIHYVIQHLQKLGKSRNNNKEISAYIKEIFPTVR